jgi:hypothetical protein
MVFPVEALMSTKFSASLDPDEDQNPKEIKEIEGNREGFENKFGKLYMRVLIIGVMVVVRTARPRRII